MQSPLDHVIVWDLETVPDLPCVARVNGFDESDEEAAREKLGEKFPKLIFHAIVTIGALIAERVEGVWIVRSLGAPNIAERTEADLIQTFVDRIAEFRPQLVTFNGSSFDLPVLRYRAMINRVSAPGLHARNYWNRYTEDALDLCDALGSFMPNAKTSLSDLCRALGFPGKPDDIDGGEVERYVREGRIGDVANYCELDVASTYRVWLVHELFRGRLSRAEFEASEDNLLGFLQERVVVKPHLSHLTGVRLPPSSENVAPL
ncbi:MAG: ribonuclease H-like domain-containing protein [Microvirga sp.]|jgi:predicted PolB exonuclease-like 3'-5' exonuclease